MVGLGRLGMGFGAVGLAALSNGLMSSAIADNFHLENGQVIEGTVLKGTLNTITLQTGNAIQLTTISQIERVVLKLADGSELGGELLSWNDGIFEVRSADLVLRVLDGEVLSDDAATTEIAAQAEPAKSEIEDTDTATDTVTMASLPSFVMKNGDKLVGKILHATGSVLTIRPSGGSALPISRAQIESVSVQTEAGEKTTGALIGWKDGIYRLQLDDRELLASLPDSAVAPSTSEQVSTSETVEVLLDKPVATEIEQADAAALPPTDAEQLDAEQLVVEDIDEAIPAEVGVGGPVNETAVAALATDDADDGNIEPVAGAVDGQHLIETVVEAVEEGSESVVVKFQLDKPAARPLVVLYAATESSAKAGEDFEAKSGVITFATGSSYAEVQVPIIDDDQGEESEKFNLFLSGDPETIAFSERQIAITINDND